VAILLADFFNLPVAVLHADYHAQTDCNPADVGQVDFLIGKRLQVDNPFSPSVNRC